MDDVKPLGRAYTGSTATAAARTMPDILDAAQDLFVRVGYAATTMAAVAAQAGVAPATTHAGFASKRGLLEAVMDRIVARGKRPAPVDIAQFRGPHGETHSAHRPPVIRGS